MTTEKILFSGADWVAGFYQGEMSPLGRRVADLLGYLYQGIYHLCGVEEIDWSRISYIEVPLKNYTDLASFDFSHLTILVMLAHHMAIRVCISPRSHRSLTLLFHARQRSGSIDDRHPTIDETIERFRCECYLPSWEEENKNGGQNG